MAHLVCPALVLVLGSLIYPVGIYIVNRGSARYAIISGEEGWLTWNFRQGGFGPKVKGKIKIREDKSPTNGQTLIVLANPENFGCPADALLGELKRLLPGHANVKIVRVFT